MLKVESYREYWPVRVPSSLPLPETSVFDNLRVSASRYPGRAASVPYGTEISQRMAAYEYPCEVSFVDALPKSGSGKILCRQLREEEQRKTAGAK